jgi:uncharacterized protein
MASWFPDPPVMARSRRRTINTCVQFDANIHARAAGNSPADRFGAAGRFSMDDAIANKLEQRLGRLHAKQRLGIEKDHEAQIFGQGINFFHIENWYSIHSLIRNALKLGGIFWRGQRNAERIQVRHNYVRCQRVPTAFNGFTLLHISDLHVDMNKGAMRRLEQLLPDLEYDMCVITGDYRGATFGPFTDALEGMKRLRSLLRKKAYGVLGNHDTIRMVPGLEEMGICILLNECDPISRGGRYRRRALLSGR